MQILLDMLRKHMIHLTMKSKGCYIQKKKEKIKLMKDNLTGKIMNQFVAR